MTQINFYMHKRGLLLVHLQGTSMSASPDSLSYVVIGPHQLTAEMGTACSYCWMAYNFIRRALMDQAKAYLVPVSHSVPPDASGSSQSTHLHLAF